jgi:hypothetical protein
LRFERSEHKKSQCDTRGKGLRQLVGVQKKNRKAKRFVNLITALFMCKIK